MESFHASLLEAAFMTGLERNADIVHMATYAPFVAHVEGGNGVPDMIWFDNLKSVRSVTLAITYSRLYAHNKGTNVVPLTMNNKPVIRCRRPKRIVCSAVWGQRQSVVHCKGRKYVG
jgi:hypothetical protein